MSNTGKSKVEFTARITGPDGSIIEKTFSSMHDIPTPEEFDLCTRDGLLRDFDAFEKAIMEARNTIGKEITQEYLNEASKKNSSRGNKKK